MSSGSSITVEGTADLPGRDGGPARAQDRLQAAGGAARGQGGHADRLQADAGRLAARLRRRHPRRNQQQVRDRLPWIVD